MFKKGHKNKKIHLLRLAVMQLPYPFAFLDAVGYML